MLLPTTELCPRPTRKSRTPRREGASFSGMESLERRALFAASISGVVMNDLSGNGLSALDKPLSGIVVKLYKDVNANGTLELGVDGPALTQQTTGANGKFNFGGLSTGKYLVVDIAGSDTVVTNPLVGNVVPVNVTNPNGSYNNIKFANYVKKFDESALSGIYYTINGTKTVSKLQNQVKEGDVVTAHFTVAQGKKVELTLVSYKSPSNDFDGESVQQQKIFDLATGCFGPGQHCLTVCVPNCYFQIDFVGGKAINKFGPTESNIGYRDQDRLISHNSGGTKACPCDPRPQCQRDNDDRMCDNDSKTEKCKAALKKWVCAILAWLKKCKGVATQHA